VSELHFTIQERDKKERIKRTVLILHHENNIRKDEIGYRVIRDNKYNIKLERERERYRKG
jgi:hypothetical protein